MKMFAYWLMVIGVLVAGIAAYDLYTNNVGLSLLEFGFLGIGGAVVVVAGLTVKTFVDRSASAKG